jgi:hypothetical protein
MKWGRQMYKRLLLKVSMLLIPHLLVILVLSGGVGFAFVRSTDNETGAFIDWTYKANPMGENYLVNENCADCSGRPPPPGATLELNLPFHMVAPQPVRMVLLMMVPMAYGGPQHILQPDHRLLLKLLIGTTKQLVISVKLIAYLMTTKLGARLTQPQLASSMWNR